MQLYPGNRILVYDTLDGLWDLQGFYDNAVETNDRIIFSDLNGKPTLRILCVSVM